MMPSQRPVGVDPRSMFAVPALARLPTGAKLFLVLSICLLPLALIAIVATLRTTQFADDETRARLRVASSESAHAIAIELVGDMTALNVAMHALDRDPADAPSCARAQGVFAQRSSTGARFTVVDRTGRVLCGAPVAVTALPVEGVPIAANHRAPVSACCSGSGRRPTG